MTWLENLQGCDNLKAFLQHTTVSILVSKIDGSILWANTAFLHWSGYTLTELQKYGWKQISVPGDEFHLGLIRACVFAAKAILPQESVCRLGHHDSHSISPLWGNRILHRYLDP